ncbi:MAG TPA: rod shape-determining protein RodA [Flavobacteriaceae bacterium]|nr:rod shape-determining protein RodA [Flavobacteriaceae bacterium]
MRSRTNNIFYGIDWLLVLFYCILVFAGWLNIYATTSTDESLNILNLSTEYGKQLLWIILSVPLILLTLLFDAKFYEKFASIIYIAILFLLIGLFIFGKNINGATSWYSFGGFSLQPSEFAKAATALAIAKLTSDKQFNLKKINAQIKVLTILALPALLITLQPDPGSALIYTAFIFVLNREGLPSAYIIIALTVLALFILTLIFGVNTILITTSLILISILFYLFFFRRRALRLGWIRIIGVYVVSILFVFSVDYVFNNVFKQRHRDRFDIVLGKKEDVKSIGYNTNQSVTTIASGGLFGKGFLEGERTQGDFVPEQQTDYIFTTVGEEWGFLGSSFIILIFILFLIRILIISERQKTKFSRIYGYSIAAIFFFHFTINIGMVLGLLPTIGIPLPFFSYGGSALWGFTLLLFIFIRLDANRLYEW